MGRGVHQDSDDCAAPSSWATGTVINYTTIAFRMEPQASIHYIQMGNYMSMVIKPWLVL